MMLQPLGDLAVTMVLEGTGGRVPTALVRAVAAELAQHPPPGVTDVVPAFASIALYFDAGHAPDTAKLGPALEEVVRRVARGRLPPAGRTVEIPVCYGGEHGPDLAAVAAHTRLREAEVIARHAGGDYLVQAIGFAPGFPYLAGLPAELAVPRRATPRERVAPGSVGIGGEQTGVYPLETPGGWNLIGRTPERLFDAARAEPALLRAGDRVRFRPVTEEAFAAGRGPASEPSGKEEALESVAGGLTVLRSGMLTTVQDAGRVGWRAGGVPLSGAVDGFALRLLNLLVGNPEDAAGLEFTLVGPDLRFERDAIVALGGGEFAGLPRWRPVEIAAGTVLRLGAAASGCRGYLAVGGGVAVEKALGSRSTYARAGLGGWRGRALRKGDLLPLGECAWKMKGHWSLNERILPAYSGAPTVRVTPGAQAGEYRNDWLGMPFTVGRQSDRMGLRLEGRPLRRSTARELMSTPVAVGTIQVPPDGHPIVLLADAQTIGGYPQLAQVATVDLPLLAHLRPGDAVRFEPIELADAQALLAARERRVALLREGLREKRG